MEIISLTIAPGLKPNPAAARAQLEAIRSEKPVTPSPTPSSAKAPVFFAKPSSPPAKASAPGRGGFHSARGPWQKWLGQ